MTTAIRTAETQTTAPSYYKLQDLGTLSGQNSCQPYSIPYGTNDFGHVVGESSFAGCFEGGITHAFLYEDDQMKDLNTLMGIDSSYYTSATDINDSGQIVGTDYVGNWESHAFLYDSTNGMKDLGTLGGSGSSASAINDSGQVVGGAYNSSGQYRAFLYDSTNGMKDLGTLGGTYSSAYAISASGQIVGVSSTASGQGHAFLYKDGVLKDLGTLGGSSSAADINASGQVVGGSYDSSGNYHAFLYQNEEMMDLGTRTHPDNNGRVWNLGSRNGTSGATKINNKGQIVTEGWRKETDGYTYTDRALLLTTTSDSPPPADSEAPSPPTITSPADNSYDTDGNITFSGTAEKGSTVKVYQDGATTTTTTTAAGQATASTTDGSWTINLTGVSEQSTAHTFDVTATDAAGNESTATTRHVTVQKVPYAPSGLTALQKGTTTSQCINLVWADNSGNEKNFVLERTTNKTFSSGVVSTTLAPNTTSYRDTKNLSRKTTYYYRVKATNNAGSSAYSTTASATTR